MEIVKEAAKSIANSEVRRRIRAYGSEVVTILSDEDSLDYKESSTGIGQGVRVPLIESNSRSLLDKSAGPYGVIVQGKTYTTDASGTGLIPIGDFIPHILTIKEEKKEMPLGQEVEDVDSPTQEDINIDQILKRLEENTKKSRETEKQVEYKRKSEYKVKFKGNFGTFSGNFLDLEITPEYIICVYVIGESVFIPPYISPEEASIITITDCCNNESHAVYYSGITFELPQFNAGFIIFMKAKE